MSLPQTVRKDNEFRASAKKKTLKPPTYGDLEQTSHSWGTPTLSIPGLLDLIDALHDELAAASGIVPLLSNTLHEELEEGGGR